MPPEWKTSCGRFLQNRCWRIEKTSPVIELPMPDGKMARFINSWESMVWCSQVLRQKKYPQIKQKPSWARQVFWWSFMLRCDLKTTTRILVSCTDTFSQRQGVYRSVMRDTTLIIMWAIIHRTRACENSFVIHLIIWLNSINRQGSLPGYSITHLPPRTGLHRWICRSSSRSVTYHPGCISRYGYGGQQGNRRIWTGGIQFVFHLYQTMICLFISMAQPILYQ